jgi:hypothetical protein
MRNRGIDDTAVISPPLVAEYRHVDQMSEMLRKILTRHRRERRRPGDSLGAATERLDTFAGMTFYNLDKYFDRGGTVTECNRS